MWARDKYYKLWNHAWNGAKPSKLHKYGMQEDQNMKIVKGLTLGYAKHEANGKYNPK